MEWELRHPDGRTMKGLAYMNYRVIPAEWKFNDLYHKWIAQGAVRVR